MSNIEQEQTYALLLQNSATNAITHTSVRKNAFTVHPITKEGTLKSGDLTLVIEDFTNPLPVSARKLFDALAIEFTKQTNYRGKSLPALHVTLPLRQYVELCGQDPDNKPQVDKARRRVKVDLKMLLQITLKWQGRNKRDFLEAKICSKVGITRGVIHFTFAPDLAEYLQQAYIMPYNTQLFRLDSRNPNTWSIARKLNERYSMNRNNAAGKGNTLSVTSLLRAAPDIPSLEEVAKTNRHYWDRIIAPLENTLNQLVSIKFLKEWTYWNVRNTPLTDNQLAVLDYKTVLGLYVHYELVRTPPDQTPQKAGPVRKKPRH